MADQRTFGWKSDCPPKPGRCSCGKRRWGYDKEKRVWVCSNCGKVGKADKEKRHVGK